MPCPHGTHADLRRPPAREFKSKGRLPRHHAFTSGGAANPRPRGFGGRRL